MARSVSGYNDEARISREHAMKYVQIWQFELTKIGAALTADLSSKKITKAVYDMRKAELVKSTEDLNKCIKTLNAQHSKM
ncbi:MAG: hypothetical protein FWF78_04110 [Defluviitaleaceae bacterium]|nr:hypothetical protein [Defluviitaleaceae bacterium]